MFYLQNVENCNGAVARFRSAHQLHLEGSYSIKALSFGRLSWVLGSCYIEENLVSQIGTGPLPVLQMQAAPVHASGP